MKVISLAAAVAAALALTACEDGGWFANNAPTTSGPVRTGPMGGTDRQMAVASSMSQMTSDYVTWAAMSDMYEIEAGRLAAQKARNPRVKNFAQMMVTDHTSSSQRLQQAMPSGLTMNMPTQLDAEHQAKLSQLQNAPAGAGFDRMYLQQQVMAHEQALALHQNYGRAGDVPALRNVATSVAPVVETHLREARTLAR